MNKRVALFKKDEGKAEIEKSLQFDSILKIKKLKSTFDMMSAEIMRNHVQMGMVESAGGEMNFIAGDLSSKDGDPGASGQLGGIMGKGLFSWKNYFAIIVSSKAFSPNNEVVDDQFIRESDMPHWMDLDTLYLFSFDNPKDDSEFKFKYSGSQFLVIEPIKAENIKGNYSFVLETKDKYAFYGVKFCKELNRWLAALRKAKQTIEEIARTKNQSLAKNVDPLVTLYKKKVE